MQEIPNTQNRDQMKFGLSAKTDEVRSFGAVTATITKQHHSFTLNERG